VFVAGWRPSRLVPQQFFPSSDRPELLVDLRLPEGASFAATLRETQRFESALANRPEIDHFIDFVGAGAPRFYLPLDQQLAAPNFAQFVVTAKSVKDREKLAAGFSMSSCARDYSIGAHADQPARERAAHRLSRCSSASPVRRSARCARLPSKVARSCAPTRHDQRAVRLG
jgi:multidrug efflux pump subunit AcrB